MDYLRPGAMVLNFGRKSRRKATPPEVRRDPGPWREPISAAIARKLRLEVA